MSDSFIESYEQYLNGMIFLEKARSGLRRKRFIQADQRDFPRLISVRKNWD